MSLRNMPNLNFGEKFSCKLDKFMPGEPVLTITNGNAHCYSTSLPEQATHLEQERIKRELEYMFNQVLRAGHAQGLQKVRIALELGGD